MEQFGSLGDRPTRPATRITKALHIHDQICGSVALSRPIAVTTRPETGQRRPCKKSSGSARTDITTSWTSSQRPRGASKNGNSHPHQVRNANRTSRSITARPLGLYRNQAYSRNKTRKVAKEIGAVVATGSPTWQFPLHRLADEFGGRREMDALAQLGNKLFGPKDGIWANIGLLNDDGNLVACNTRSRLSTTANFLRLEGTFGSTNVP